MRKRWLITALTLTLVLGISVGATAAGTRRDISVNYSGITMKVDGKLVQTGDSQPFVVVDEGRTYVPARYLAEALGAKVGFDATSQTVQIYTPRYVESVTSGGTTAYALPYYGSSLTLPAGGTRRDMNSVLLQVEYKDVAVQLQRVDIPTAVSFDMMETGILGALQSSLQLKLTSQTDVTVKDALNARDAKGTMQMAGLTVPVWARFVQDRSQNFWTVLVFSDPAAKVDDARAASLIGGFSLSTH